MFQFKVPGGIESLRGLKPTLMLLALVIVVVAPPTRLVPLKGDL